MNFEDNGMKKRVLAALVAGGLTLAPLSDCYAKKDYREGTFLEETIESKEKTYLQYVVKEGDNASVISRKVCRYFGVEVSAKYWPVIAFLNNYPRVINPGDIVLLPNSFEVIEEMNYRLKAVGWTSRYVIKNKIYKKTKKSLPRETVAQLLYDIYGPSVCVDEDFIRLYLRILGLDDKYDLTDGQSMDNDMLFDLTEWIPTLEELGITSSNIYHSAKIYETDNYLMSFFQNADNKETVLIKKKMF